MSYETIVALLNPAMSAIYCVSLFVLWRHQRHLVYIAIFATSYALRTVCFAVLYLAISRPAPELRVLSNSLILLSMILLSVALSYRLGQRPRCAALLAIGSISTVLLYIYQFAAPNMPARALILNIGLAGICLLMLFDIATRLHRNRTPVERLLFGLVALSCVGFLLRPLVFQVSGITADRLEEMYWQIVSISDALICSTLAVAIFAMIAVDVTENIKTEAETDVLSGLLNRRGFEARAFGVLSGPTVDTQATVILGDLDHFKSINDRFGHGSGDRIIGAFSDILRNKAPHDAIIARIGGEEFAIMLPAGSSIAAHRVAEAVRSAFKEIAPGIVSNEFNPTASFGIATARKDEGLLGLMERADRALYQAKNQGRDCVRQVA